MDRKWYEDFDDNCSPENERKIDNGYIIDSVKEMAGDVNKKVIKSLFNINASSSLVNFKGKRVAFPSAVSEQVTALLGDGDVSFTVDSEQSAVLGDIIKSSARIAKSCGHNPACVVVGYASWKPVGEESLLRSPLVLIPVSIHKNGNRVTVSAQKNPATINQALVNLLESKGVDVSFAAKGVTAPDKILRDMESLSASPMIQHFEVVRDIDIAVVDFRNAVMIKELESHTAELASHPVVSGLLGLSDYTAPPLDRSVYTEPYVEHTIFPADDYQAQAISACSKGYSAVIQGPPGGGKSRTIANMVGKSIGEGKRVLVVSEKIEALKIVTQQINETPIGKYTVDLSSVKNTPQRLLNQINDNCKTEPCSTDLKQLSHKMEKCFRALEEYQAAAHSKGTGWFKAGVSLYDMIGAVICDDYPLGKFKGLFPNPLGVSESFYETLESEVKTIASVIEKLGAYGENTRWTSFNVNRKSAELAELVNDLQDSLTKADTLLQAIENKCSVSVPHTIRSATAVCDLEWSNADAVDRFCAENGYTSNHGNPSAALNKTAFSADLASLHSRLNALADRYRRYIIPDGTVQSMLEDAVITHSSAEELTALYKSCVLASSYVEEFNKLCGTAFSNSVTALYRIREFTPCFYIKRELLENALHNADCFELREHINALNATSERFNWLETRLRAALHASAFEHKATERLMEWNELVNTKYSNIAYLLPEERREYTEMVNRLNGYRVQPSFGSLTHSEVKRLLEEYSEYVSLRNTRSNSSKALDAVLYGDQPSAYQAIDIDKILRILDSEENRQLLKRVIRFDIKPAADCNSFYLRLKMLEEAFPNLRTDLLDKYSTQLIFAGGFESDKRITLSGIAAAAEKVSAVWRDVCKARAEIAALGNKGNSIKSIYRALLWLMDEDNTSRALDAVSQSDNAYSSLSVAEVKGTLKSTLAEINGYVTAIKRFFTGGFDFTLDDSTELNSLKTEYLAQLDQISLERYLEYVRALSAADAVTRGFFKACVAEGVDLSTNYALLFKRCFYSEVLRALDESAKSPIRCFDEHALQAATDDYAQLVKESHRLEISRIYSYINNDISTRLAEDSRLYSAQQARVNGMLTGTRSTIREIITTVPELFKLTVRCVLATPVDVVSFTPCNGTDFDVVIFDEASQVIPANAISSLMRAPQCIIVGDSKQLPPTSFFQKQASEDEIGVDDEEIYTGEAPTSILESASYVLPTLSLDFHYRSAHESLIEFSNNNLYTVSGETVGRINTIPDVEPIHPTLGVDFVKCDNARYEDGANPDEAKMCISLVEKYINSTGESAPSVMMVTFGIKQKRAVIAAIEEYKRTHQTKTAQFFQSTDLNELVKNLESVQGNEKDYVILSVGYNEKKDNGKVKCRFGPLTASGGVGARRLNVAITRARKKITVVSSFLAEDMEVEQGSGNARLLRDFLHYARYNRTQMPQSRTSSSASKDAFCNAVKDILQRNGYTCHLNAGRSNFNIDIAVVDPKNNNKYIAAILCDSPSSLTACKTYYSRYVNKDALLSARGWNVIRLWSGLWGKQPEYQKKLLLTALKDIADKQ